MSFELVVYTILPSNIMNQIYEMIPGVTDIISHTLCYEDMYFDIFENGFTCKDISLLAQNRENKELIVVDVIDIE